jgi:hypothetical protein
VEPGRENRTDCAAKDVEMNTVEKNTVERKT